MSIAIVSGGTATNSLIPSFLRLHNVRKISFVLPISDNGGSSAEILRVFGGPALGDLRSRITKLGALTQDPTSSKGLARFFNHRLSLQEEDAVLEWQSVLSQKHPIWALVPDTNKKRFIAEAFEVLQKVLEDNETYFNFQNASIGNLFMLGLRLGHDYDLNLSLKAFLSFLGIDEKYLVVPAINLKSRRYNIAALLADGTVIKGQSQISHPSSTPKRTNLTSPSDIDLSTINLDKPQLVFQKNHTQPLKSPINKIFYIDEQYREYQPEMFSGAVDSLKKSSMLVYSIGSLFTSIIPVLVLKGAGEAIVRNTGKKILLLNGNSDRETGDQNALDFIEKIVSALLYSQNKLLELECASGSLNSSFQKLLKMEKLLGDKGLKITDFITHVFVLQQCNIKYDIDMMQKLGLQCICVKSRKEKLSEGLGVNTLAVVNYKYDLIDFGQKLEQVVGSK